MLRTTSLVTISVLCCVTPSARSQNAGAALTGTVWDISRNPVAGAVVEVKQEETGLLRSTETSSSGVYTMQGLPIGRYTILARKPGFSPAQLAAIELLVGQTRSLDITLVVAGATA